MACQHDGNAGEHTRRRCAQEGGRVVLSVQYVQRACSTTARTHVLSDMLLGVGREAATACPPFPSCQHNRLCRPEASGGRDQRPSTIDRHLLCSISWSRLEACEMLKPRGERRLRPEKQGRELPPLSERLGPRVYPWVISMKLAVCM